MSSIDTRRQEKDRNYPRAENSGIYAAPSIASRKYFDYYATPTSTRQSSLPREQAREAQRPRNMHRHSSSLASSLTSSLPSSRGHPSIPPTARGYAGIASDSRASRAPPVQESPASSQLQSARMTNYQAQAFDYYRTPSSSRASGTTATSAPQDLFTRRMRALQQPDRLRVETLEAPAKRPGLECTVCGPGATGPWRRGPIGPYTLCDSCAKIEWKEVDASLPLTVHEALSLLDNMRFIRLASVARKIVTPDQEALTRRLQRGLPESTYTRAEEFFVRQAQMPASEPVQRCDTATGLSYPDIRSSAGPYTSGSVLAGQKRQREPAPSPPREIKRTALEACIEDRRDFGGWLSFEATKNYLSTRGQIDGLSPHSIAVAALLEQGTSTQPAPTRMPLTPSGVEVSSARNREVDNSTTETASRVESHCVSRRDAAEREETSASRPSTTEGAATPAVVTSRDAGVIFSKPFPFRQNDPAKQLPSTRIIDRRRARNEDMRRKYMEKRLEQQRAREAKLTAKSEEGIEETSRSAAAPSRVVETPVSAASNQSSISTPGISKPPASLRNLLNSLPKSS